MRETKTEFIIVRVTKTEKANLLRAGLKLRKTLSQHVRTLIGLDK